MRYIDAQTARVIKKRIRTATQHGFGVLRFGYYKKRTISGHHHHCHLCEYHRIPRPKAIEDWNDEDLPLTEQDFCSKI